MHEPLLLCCNFFAASLLIKIQNVLLLLTLELLYFLPQLLQLFLQLLLMLLLL